jgi:pyruvate dehydrogenase E2 component (dihydrolipoamide acetyltransferase)
MPIEITMPRLSDTMESGTVLKWNVAVGDAVSAGDVVADVETDKATMELTVYDDGTIAQILIDEGATVDVGTPIALMAEDGEDAGAAEAPAASAAPAADAVPAPEAPAAEAPAAPARGDGRQRITPVARRLAEEHGIDVSRLSGSGPGGRIIKRDVLQAVETAGETAASVPPSAAAPAAPAARADAGVPVTHVPVVAGATPPPHAVPAALQVGEVPLSNMRQTIARRLVESTTTIPHYQVSMSFDMEPLLALRKTLNEQLAPVGVKLSVNDFLVRCCGLAMHQHPDFNASWGGDRIIVHPEVNVGVAISVGPERGGGLVVGVIRNADQKSLRAISLESKQLSEKARTRGLTVEEMTGATFTLSNLGMFGVDHFTAIINPPNSAILAVGAAVQKPVVRDGELVVGHEMTATLSNDHRVIDGAMAAQFLRTLKGYIEAPGLLVV